MWKPPKFGLLDVKAYWPNPEAVTQNQIACDHPIACSEVEPQLVLAGVKLQGGSEERSGSVG